ncbi:hypothetical protein [Leucobacter chromiireducens]|uniref:hypothetical protein n=1 Tax=Leucobacter chromiireducens TaxID=283877 RepID=UPI000F6409DE|nr:hypothetical protein [Leucobacter chromiireducens]
MSSSTNQTWDDYFNEVEAEIGVAPEAEQHSPEEQRYTAKKEARDLANKLRIAGPSGLPRTGNLPEPLGPNASGKDIAARINL